MPTTIHYFKLRIIKKNKKSPQTKKNGGRFSVIVITIIKFGENHQKTILEEYDTSHCDMEILYIRHNFFFA